MTKPDKQFLVRIPYELYEFFYQTFPNHGAKSIFIRETIRELKRQLSKEDGLLDLSAVVQAALKSPSLRLVLQSNEKQDV
jgi:hypothetical protein